MQKTPLAAASFYKRGYSFNPTYGELPKDIQAEIQVICVTLTEKIHGVFAMGFYEDGRVYFEACGNENDYDFDEIGAGLEIERLTKEKKELVRALSLWYAMYRTPEGKAARDQLFRDRQEGLS